MSDPPTEVPVIHPDPRPNVLDVAKIVRLALNQVLVVKLRSLSASLVLDTMALMANLP